MAVSKRLRYEVLRRDNFACRYCGGRAPDIELVVDHVTPKALGGTDTPDNLVASCGPCNRGKSSASADSALVADVADDALRWAAAMNQSLAEMGRRDDVETSAVRACDERWDEWRWGGRNNSPATPAPRPEGWQESIRAFVRAGLPEDTIVDLVDVAMGRADITAGRVWRYFCGCCWRRVEDLQRRAAEILREGD